ncbi:pimeloyl-ACP methyl ester carboxylesterase [Mycobacterium frederiksbergense]|uniref:Pimeloyl-ACP methyl ester carboxylesterase n=1 Tax=Mycolicibacterium frederiksbergense TaxID=117567 RepID=A0ABT6L122_9MYCO|nr:hypothetical protein [Mycolicibacterium frederiksbergense]MDH6196650.1 pimeloyl-ACP methyl ester carboxylesterase [Mycolicibacterium frederiksbergense]
MAPVLIVWPTEDRVIPLQPHGIGWRQLIPDAKWRFVGDVGHVPMLDDPDLITRIVLHWTTRVISAT